MNIRRFFGLLLTFPGTFVVSHLTAAMIYFYLFGEDYVYQQWITFLFGTLLTLFLLGLLLLSSRETPRPL